MPIAIFAVIVVVLQAINVMGSIAIEQYISAGASVTAFALLYLGAFWLAWRITVWVIDSLWVKARTTKRGPVVGILIAAAQAPMFA
jgi:hypothetical protein